LYAPSRVQRSTIFVMAARYPGRERNVPFVNGLAAHRQGTLSVQSL
jgi:hypothetical protein